MFGILPLTPAYGRNYKSAKAVREDFEKNLDFKTADGKYINLVNIIDDIKHNPNKWPDEIEIRYNNLRSLVMINLNKAIKNRTKLIRTLAIGEEE